VGQLSGEGPEIKSPKESIRKQLKLHHMIYIKRKARSPAKIGMVGGGGGRIGRDEGECPKKKKKDFTQRLLILKKGKSAGGRADTGTLLRDE